MLDFAYYPAQRSLLMARIIHRVLQERLSQHERWHQFRNDFHALTGQQVELVDSWGMPDANDARAVPVLCHCMANDRAGNAMCLRQRQQILERGGPDGICVQCDVGLYEIAVAVDVHGVRIGYLVCRGFRDPGDAPNTRNRIRHLAGKERLQTHPERLLELHSHSKAATSDQKNAIRNILVMAAESFAHLLAEYGSPQEDQLPPAVSKACRIIRTHALSGRTRLTDTAAACGISAEHLSRIFHQSTGLSYNEYVTRFRLEHATDLLRNTAQSITEIAHESGFQSLSQFHRSFRAVFRQSPRAYRKAKA